MKPSAIPEPGDILFLHGLESSPQARKAVFLSAHYRGEAVDLDTSAAIANRDAALAAGQPWTAGWPGLDEAFAVPLARTRAALAARRRRLVIGSSFGGAVLLRLIAEGAWQGPSLLLASAGLKLTPHRSLPAGHRAILIHGRRDAVVPLDDSRRLAGASGREVQLWEVGDEHSLPSILEDGTLEAAISLLTGLKKQPSAI